MKKAIILFGLVAILASCNTGRIAELEAENMELKATVEMLKDEARLAQLQTERAMAVAMRAQIMAEEQAKKAQEAAENAAK